MSRYVIGSGLKTLAVVISRASAVALVMLGLAPPAAAEQAQPVRRSVGERIERVRNALHEQGPAALGPLAGALGTGDQDPEEPKPDPEKPKPKPKPKPPDWNDWNDWSDF
jgi:hypothetical protein